jgi:hypothetical protein
MLNIISPNLMVAPMATREEVTTNVMLEEIEATQSTLNSRKLNNSPSTQVHSKPHSTTNT